MAYPFAKAPTTGDVIGRLIGLGAELRELAPVMGPKGLVVIRYLALSTGNGTILFSEPLAENDDERVGWDKLRRICQQLKVDLVDLEIPGLHLG